MRIAILTPGFSADEADWAIPVLQHLIRHISPLHDIQVFSLRYPHRRSVYPFYEAHVSALGGADASGLGRLPLFPKTMQTIMRAHARRKFDLVHGFWADEAGFLAVAAGALLRIPAIVSVMGGELVRYPELGYGGQLSLANRILTRVALQAADLVTIGSENLRPMVARPRGAKSTVTFPLGVDTDQFNPGTSRPDQVGMAIPGPHLLCVASLTPIKNHVLLFEAFRSVLERVHPLHLHLVGDGPLRQELEVLATTLNIQPHLTFHGAIPHQKMVDFYRTADLLVVSSHFESQGMAVLEAGACGLPTLGTKVGILPDLGPTVCTVPVADPSALSQAMTEIVQDPSRRAEMSRGLSAHVHTHYAIQSTAEALSALYHRVC